MFTVFHSLVERVFCVMNKYYSMMEGIRQNRNRGVTGVFRPFRLPDYQDTGSIFLRKISTFGGRPPFLTIWILAF